MRLSRGLGITLAVTAGMSSLPASQALAQRNFARELATLGQNTAEVAEAERLHQLFGLTWDFAMVAYPEWATSVGYPGQNHRWTDESEEAIERRYEVMRQILLTLRTIDREPLTEADQLYRDLLELTVTNWLEPARFRAEYLAINQMGGVQQGVPQTLVQMRANNTSDYEDMIARLQAVPELVDQEIALLQRGLESGITPPQITLRDVPEQVNNLLVDDPLTRPMLSAFTRFPESVPERERERLTEEAVEAFTTGVLPAYETLRDFLSDTYIPGARTSIAASDLPNGSEWYASRVRRYTTTDLTPQEIHDLGLSEVSRIRAEMDSIVALTGFAGTFADFLEFLRTDPQFYHDDAESLLSAYRDISKRADPELARLFGRLPRLPYGIRQIPSYAEKSQTTAYYQGGSTEAGRPGYFFANTYNLPARPKWEMVALTLHEAVPGHHLQIALAQEMEAVPEFRKHTGYTAFVEGWALYAESLGEEMGLYQDPYSKFGQLTYEMWRAIRLVVDTGMHALGWTRQQAIDFFMENTGKTEHDITVEVDRYIVWPGQALAYKIGELKIQELRAYAAGELGDQFDIRAFHDEVLRRGALPLGALERFVRHWVSEQQAALEQG